MAQAGDAPDASFAVYSTDRPRVQPAWWRRPRTLVTAGCAMAAIFAFVALDQFLRGQSAQVLVADDYGVGTVQRGRLTITVQGAGTLKPFDERWLTAKAAGVLEEVRAGTGVRVAPGDIVARLSNPELSQALRQAEHGVAEASANHTVLVAQLEDRKLAQDAALARAQAALEEAELRLRAEAGLFEENAISAITHEATRIRAEQARIALDIERRRATQLAETKRAETQASAARLAGREVAFEQAAARQASLDVRAQIGGVVQELPLNLGESVREGMKVARIADPSRLRAVVRVPESQATRLTVGQPTEVKVLNVDVPATVRRVDPSVSEGSVVVDLEFTGELPVGVRPDLSIRATITVAEIDDALFVRRPSGAFEDHAVDVFVLDSAQDTARRRTVQFGAGSLRQVQVLDGLEEGERVVLGNIARFDGMDVVAVE